MTGREERGVKANASDCRVNVSQGGLDDGTHTFEAKTANNNTVAIRQIVNFALKTGQERICC